MLTNYQERKNEVIAEYEHFEESIIEFVRIVTAAGIPNPIEQFKDSLDDAWHRAEDIRADRFRLMIAGEAKSGKSTFINAYLGNELLPMDVKQCSSSIVEIKYGEQFKLIATYADDRKITHTDEDTIRDFLQQNAALNDDYRDIPVPTINQEILVKSGQRAKAKGKQIQIHENDVKDLLAQPEVQAANIHLHHIDTYNQKIREYIEQKKNDWQRIVVKIEIFFPFKEEALKGIEIIDSPGVCSRGGVSEITSKYIENAHAIIFLKPISGQALESSQFNDFMEKVSWKRSNQHASLDVERSKHALFLVLTRATNVTPADLGRLEEEACKQFKQLDRRNIIVVDSKAKLYVNQFKPVEEVQSRILELNKAGALDEFVKGAWFDAGADKTDFINKLESKSNFAKIDEALSTFGRKAHYIACSSLLEVIAKVYTKIIGDLKGYIARFEEKARDPVELANKIAEIKLELEKINNKMFQGVDVIVSKYSGDDGDIRKKAECAAKDFKDKVKRINADGSEAFEELERQAMHKIGEFKDLQEAIQQAVVSDCNAALIKISDESEIPFTSLEPDFSKDTFEKIKDSTKSKAQETKSYTTGITFKETHSYSQYSQNRHFKIVKNSILTRSDEIKNDLIGNLVDFIKNIGKVYIDKLKENAVAKKKELDAIYNEKLSNDQIFEIIEGISGFEVQCAELKRGADKLKGGINKHVQQIA